MKFWGLSITCIALAFTVTHGQTDPSTAAPAAPTTAVPVEPTTAVPVEPTTAAPVEPTTAVPVEPTTAAPVEPTTAVPVEPTTAAPVDPSTIAPVDPSTMPPVDPSTMDPVDPSTMAPVEPTTMQPIESTVVSIEPTTTESIESTTVPIEHTTMQPIESTAVSIEPTTTESIESTTMPIEPTTMQPIDSTAVSIEPTTTMEPIESTTVPIEPTTLAPARPHYTVMQDGKACLLADVYIDLHINYTTTDNQTDTAMLKFDEIKTMVSGSCSSNISSLVLKFDSMDGNVNHTNTLTLTFDNDKMDKVTLSEVKFVYYIGSKTYFPNATFDPKDEMRTISNMKFGYELSDAHQFYVCKKMRKFSVDSESSISFTDMKLQAFDIVNNTYSPDGKDCATTPTPRLSTAYPTPAPNTPQYSLRNEDNDVCLLAQMDTVISVIYLTTSNSTRTTMFNFTIIPNVTVTGTCATENTTTSTIILSFPSRAPTSFFDDEVMYDIEDRDPSAAGDANVLTMTFDETKKVVSIHELMFTYDLNSPYFPDADFGNNSMRTVKEMVDKPLTDSDMFYSCQNLPDYSLGNTTTLKISNLKLQAFNVANDTFSQNGMDCNAPPEVVSPKIPTVPPTVSTPTTYTYKFSDCVLFEAGIRLDIDYTNNSTGKVVTRSIDLHNQSQLLVGGVCNTKNGSNTLTIQRVGTPGNWLTFFLSILIGKPDDDHVAIQEVMIAYVHDKQFFQDSSKQGQTDMSSTGYNKDGLDDFKWGKSEAYKCSKSTATLDKGGKVVFYAYDLHVEAFRDSNSTDFTLSDKSCSDDLTSAIVPIAVGAALAALVVIVLIAYLIGRRRSRSGYENI